LSSAIEVWVRPSEPRAKAGTGDAEAENYPGEVCYEDPVPFSAPVVSLESTFAFDRPEARSVLQSPNPTRVGPGSTAKDGMVDSAASTLLS